MSQETPDERRQRELLYGNATAQAQAQARHDGVLQDVFETPQRRQDRTFGPNVNRELPGVETPQQRHDRVFQGVFDRAPTAPIETPQQRHDRVFQGVFDRAPAAPIETPQQRHDRVFQGVFDRAPAAPLETPQQRHDRVFQGVFDRAPAAPIETPQQRHDRVFQGVFDRAPTAPLETPQQRHDRVFGDVFRTAPGAAGPAPAPQGGYGEGGDLQDIYELILGDGPAGGGGGGGGGYGGLEPYFDGVGDGGGGGGVYGEFGYGDGDGGEDGLPHPDDLEETVYRLHDSEFDADANIRQVARWSDDEAMGLEAPGPGALNRFEHDRQAVEGVHPIVSVLHTEYLGLELADFVARAQHVRGRMARVVRWALTHQPGLRAGVAQRILPFVRYEIWELAHPNVRWRQKSSLERSMVVENTQESRDGFAKFLFQQLSNKVVGWEGSDATVGVSFKGFSFYAIPLEVGAGGVHVGARLRSDIVPELQRSIAKAVRVGGFRAYEPMTTRDRPDCLPLCLYMGSQKARDKVADVPPAFKVKRFITWARRLVRLRPTQFFTLQNLVQLCEALHLSVNVYYETVYRPQTPLMRISHGAEGEIPLDIMLLSLPADCDDAQSFLKGESRELKRITVDVLMRQRSDRVRRESYCDSQGTGTTETGETLESYDDDSVGPDMNCAAINALFEAEAERELTGPRRESVNQMAPGEMNLLTHALLVWQWAGKNEYTKCEHCGLKYLTRDTDLHTCAKAGPCSVGEKSTRASRNKQVEAKTTTKWGDVVNRLVYFDYETMRLPTGAGVLKHTRENTPYLVVFKYLDKLDDEEWTYKVFTATNEAEVLALHKSVYDLMASFNESRTFCSFNGGRFDDVFFLRAIAINEGTISSLLLKGSSNILRASISAGSGRPTHSLFDLYKITTGSLRKLSKDFNLENVDKTNFPHDLITDFAALKTPVPFNELMGRGYFGTGGDELYPPRKRNGVDVGLWSDTANRDEMYEPLKEAIDYCHVDVDVLHAAYEKVALEIYNKLKVSVYYSEKLFRDGGYENWRAKHADLVEAYTSGDFEVSKKMLLFKRGISLHKFITLSELSYFYWQHTRVHGTYAKTTAELYEISKKATFGGRTEIGRDSWTSPGLEPSKRDNAWYERMLDQLQSTGDATSASALRKEAELHRVIAEKGLELYRENVQSLSVRAEKGGEAKVHYYTTWIWQTIVENLNGIGGPLEGVLTATMDCLKSQTEVTVSDLEKACEVLVRGILLSDKEQMARDVVEAYRAKRSPMAERLLKAVLDGIKSELELAVEANAAGRAEAERCVENLSTADDPSVARRMCAWEGMRDRIVRGSRRLHGECQAVEKEIQRWTREKETYGIRVDVSLQTGKDADCLREEMWKDACFVAFKDTRALCKRLGEPAPEDRPGECAHLMNILAMLRVKVARVERETLSGAIDYREQKALILECVAQGGDMRVIEACEHMYFLDVVSLYPDSSRYAVPTGPYVYRVLETAPPSPAEGLREVMEDTAHFTGTSEREALAEQRLTEKFQIYNLVSLNERVARDVESGKCLARGVSIDPVSGNAGYETRVDEQTGEIYMPTTFPMGMFRVRWKAPDTLPIGVLAQRRLEGGIVWALKLIPENEEEGVWYTSVDLNNAVRCGYYDFEVLDGFFWDQARAPALQYIYQAFAMKQEGEASGNKSMRQIAKLLMNALYGKYGQAVHREETKFCYTAKDCQKFLLGHRWTGMVVLSDACVVMEGIPINLSPSAKPIFDKPTWVAPFILGYSRVRMTNAYLVSNPFFLDPVNPLRGLQMSQTKGDTDSLEIPKEGYERLQRYGMTHACLGGLTNDLGEGVRVVRCENIVPKVYRTWSVNQTGDAISVKAKGAGFAADDLEEEQWRTMRGVDRSPFLSAQRMGDVVLNGRREAVPVPTSTATGWFRRTGTGAPFPNFQQVLLKRSGPETRAGLEHFSSIDKDPGKFVGGAVYDRRDRLYGPTREEHDGYWVPKGHALAECRAQGDVDMGEVSDGVSQADTVLVNASEIGEWTDDGSDCDGDGDGDGNGDGGSLGCEEHELFDAMDTGVLHRSNWQPGAFGGMVEGETVGGEDCTYHPAKRQRLY